MVNYYFEPIPLTFGTMHRSLAICIVLHTLSTLESIAQLPPIGQWREHYSWSNSFRVAGNETTVWAATESSVFFIDLEENSLHPKGKLSGLSSAGIKETSWDATTGILVVGYQNNVIDLMKEDEVFPLYAIANASTTGQISIHHILTLNGQAFVSTDLGIVVIDLYKKEVKDTYVIGSNGTRTPVYCVSASKDTLYCATAEGLKKAGRQSANLSDYRNWKTVMGFSFDRSNGPGSLAAWKNGLLIHKDNTLWTWNGSTLLPLYTDDWKWIRFSISEESILLLSQKNELGRITVLNNEGVVETIIQDPLWTRSPADAFRNGNVFWIADKKSGVCRFHLNAFTGYSPNGPAQTNTGQTIFSGGTVWIAPHSISPTRQSLNRKGQPSTFVQDRWSNASDVAEKNWDSLPDIHCLAYDEKEKILWGGSWGGGLFSLQGNKRLDIFNRGTPLRPIASTSEEYRIGGLAMDEIGQLWMTNDGATEQVHARSREGKWLSFRIPFTLPENAVGRLVIDRLGQKWIQLPKRQGMACFHDGNTPFNPNDDRWRLFQSGKGLGNLPDNEVLCMALDQNDLLWIGTEKGIGVITCLENVFRDNTCETTLPVILQGNFAGYLFNDQRVQSMAVDGANRKWVGTKNGVWLLSADADSILYRFDTKNSPLPDNDIREILIHPSTGEAFFSTPGGTVSFRSTATEATEKTTAIQVFPNPVPPEYTGWIAMRGLRENTLVKITTLDGRLIFETKALGGQAIWDGKDRKGQKVASGIYLVLSAEDPKNIRSVGKIIFIGK